MSKLKHKLLFIVLSSSAYVSPLLLVVSLWTNYWLLSTERTIIPKDTETTMGIVTETNKLVVNSTLAQSSTIKQVTTTYNSLFPPTYHVYTNYGLWEFCKLSGQCIFILHTLSFLGISESNCVVSKQLCLTTCLSFLCRRQIIDYICI